MLMVERQNRVLEILRSRRSAQLDELAAELSVSASTIRRDLELLEEQGVVERTHGGAVYKGEPAERPSSQGSVALAERMKQQIDAKRAIGRYAAALVQPQMTVLLDGGSTVVYAAQQITARPIQVVTTSLNVAGMFVDDDQVELVLIGGNLYPRTGVTVGPLATGGLADLHADLLLFSLAGIYGQDCFNINLAMAQVEQAMMRQAVRSVMLMDSSKFGRKSLARVCGVSEVDQIVTDAGVESSWRSELPGRLVIAE
jgi:DeoR/GlpR family transcriptional regulator of sugar metabolism